MSKKNLTLIILTIIFSGTFIYSFKCPIEIDSIFEKILVSNKSYRYKNPFTGTKYEKPIVHINDYLEHFDMTKDDSFFEKEKFYLQNLKYFITQGIVFATLCKLPLIRDLDIWGFRLLGMIFFLLGLIYLNKIMQLFLFSDNARYITLIAISLSIHGQGIMLQGRVYATAFFFNLLCCYLVLKLLKSDKNNFLDSALLLLSMHLCILNYFMYAVFLPLTFFAIVLYAFIYRDKLGIDKSRFLSLGILLAMFLATALIYVPFKDILAGNTISDRKWDKISSVNMEFDYLYINYIRLCMNNFNPFTGTIFLICLSVLGYLSKNLKKIAIFAIPILCMPLILFVVTNYIHHSIYLVTRYSYAALPFVFMIYGLIFEKRWKLFLWVIIPLFSLTLIYPWIRHEPLHYTQTNFIDLARTTNKYDFKKRTLFVNNSALGDTVIFTKYLLETIENKPAILKQRTDKEFYITTEFFLNIDTVMQFIKDHNIEQVLYCDKFLFEKPEGDLCHVYYKDLKDTMAKLDDIEFILLVPSEAKKPLWFREFIK